jgi:hypothetical protein
LYKDDGGTFSKISRGMPHRNTPVSFGFIVQRHYILHHFSEVAALPLPIAFRGSPYSQHYLFFLSLLTLYEEEFLPFLLL